MIPYGTIHHVYIHLRWTWPAYARQGLRLGLIKLRRHLGTHPISLPPSGACS